jgi:hypothetical protein
MEGSQVESRKRAFFKSALFLMLFIAFSLGAVTAFADGKEKVKIIFNYASFFLEYNWGVPAESLQPPAPAKDLRIEIYSGVDEEGELVGLECSDTIKWDDPNLEMWDIIGSMEFELDPGEHCFKLSYKQINEADSAYKDTVTGYFTVKDTDSQDAQKFYLASIRTGAPVKTRDPKLKGYIFELYDSKGRLLLPAKKFGTDDSGNTDYQYYYTVLLSYLSTEKFDCTATPVDPVYGSVDGSIDFSDKNSEFYDNAEENPDTYDYLTSILAGIISFELKTGNNLKYTLYVTNGAGLRAKAKIGKHFTPFYIYHDEGGFKFEKVASDKAGYDKYTAELPYDLDLDVGGRGSGFLRQDHPFNVDRKGVTELTITINAEKLDRSRREKYESTSYYDSVYFNVNDAQHLVLSPSETFKVMPIRVTQAQDGWVGNNFHEPDYNVEILGDTGAITGEWKGSIGCEYEEVTATSAGVAVLKFTYDPILLNNAPSEKREDGTTSSYISKAHTSGPADKLRYYNATDPLNIGIVVVHVPTAEELTASDDVRLKTNINQREYDTIYYDRDKTDHAEYTFKPAAAQGKEINVRVHRPIHEREDSSQVPWGKGWSKTDYSDGIVLKDIGGSFTVKLYDGRSVIEVSSGVVKQYHVVQALPVKINIENKSKPGAPFTVGDTAMISFEGLQLQLAKIAGIYNPGFPSTNRVRYKISGTDKTVQSVGTQYDIGDPKKNNLEVALTGEELRLVEGSMPTGMIANVPLGGHRKILDQGGVDVSMNGSEITDTFCTLPDITIRAASRNTATVAVGAQGGTLEYGTAWSASFPVTAASVPDGTYTATLVGAPEGVSVTGGVKITDGKGTLTLATTAATPAGNHPIKLTLALDGETSVTSQAFTLTVAQKNAGNEDGYTVDKTTDPARPAVVVKTDTTFTEGTGTATTKAASGALSGAIDRAAEAAKEAGSREPMIVIPVETVTGDNIKVAIVEIPAYELKAVANSEENISVKMGSAVVGEVALNKAVIEDIVFDADDAEYVEIVIEHKEKTAEDGTLSAGQKAALSSDDVREVYEISLALDGEKRDSFKTAGKLTVGLPYTLKTGEVAAGVKVVYVPENGKTEPTEGNSYDTAKKLARFKTNHLSVYAVTYAQRNTENTENTENTGDSQNSKNQANGSGGGCGTGSLGFAALLALACATARRRKGA